MGLIKLIILAVLVLAAMAFWRQFKAWQARSKPAPPPTGTPQLMVRCKHCQIHLPQEHALREGNHWYCCKEHLNDKTHG